MLVARFVLKPLSVAYLVWDEQPAQAMPDMAHDMPESMMKPGVTRSQVVAMTVLTLLMLGGGIIVATLLRRWTK